MRTRSISLAALLVAAAGLTACSAPAGTVDGCTPTLLPGGATNQVSVAATDGAPTVEFQAPLVSDGDQAQVLGGEGERASAGDIVDASYVVYSGKTGDLLASSYESPDPTQPAATPLRLAAGGETVLGQSVECAAPGTDVVLTTSIANLFGENASSVELDITPADTAVVVLSVDEVRAGRAEGAPQPGMQGMPAIALAEDGRPGVTFPSSAAPAELTIMPSIEGTGEEVAEGDTVLLQYTGIVWETQEVFDSSWEKGEPAEFPMGEGLIPGFVEAVVGQPIGSQVVVSIPQEQGYNDPATRPASIPEGAHLLFVIDILDVVEPAAG